MWRDESRDFAGLREGFPLLAVDTRNSQDLLSKGRGSQKRPVNSAKPQNCEPPMHPHFSGLQSGQVLRTATTGPLQFGFAESPRTLRLPRPLTRESRDSRINRKERGNPREPASP